MRVLLVTHRYPPDGLAGVERYCESLNAELTQAGDTVYVLTRRPGEEESDLELVREQLSKDSTLYRIVGGLYYINRFLDDHERMEMLFSKVLVEAAPDVVHINHLLSFSPRFLDIAQRLRVPVVVSLHDFFFACARVHLQKRSGKLCAGPDGGLECARHCFHDDEADPVGIPGMTPIPDAHPRLRWGVRTAYYRRLLGLAQRVLCYSRFVGNFFQAFGVAPERLRVVPHGVGAEVAAPPVLAGPSPRERGILNLAYCGTVCRHKGVHVILDALRVAGLGSVDLRVSGETPYPDYVEELRQRAAAVPGLTLRILGPYEQAQLPGLLHDVDCLLQPSIVPETGGIAPREAMCRGIPVVVSKLGALPELVTPSENGFVFDPLRPGELAAILRRLLWEEGLLERLREGVARVPVVTKTHHAEAVRQIYFEAVEDMARHDATARSDEAEARFFHAALLDLGFRCP